MKLNSANGTTVWAKSFGGTGDDRGFSLAPVPGGGVIMSGYFAGSVDFGGKTLTAIGSQDMFVAKYNSAGAMQWANNYGGTGYVYPRALSVNSSGVIALTGVYGYGTANFGGATFPTTSTAAIFIATYNSDGSPKWSKTFGGGIGSSDNGAGIAIDNSGNVYVGGTVANALDFGGGLLYSSPLSIDAFAASFDANGTYRWASRFGGLSYDYGDAIAISPDQSAVYLTGYYTGTCVFEGTMTQGNTSALGLSSPSLQEGFVLKFQP
jgi:hypothetical protein